MADYARQHDFSTKSGTTIFGSEVDDEFDTLVTVIAGKVDESREAAANGIATLGAGALIPVGISGNATSGGGQIPEATATALGAVELATDSEATTGSDTSRVCTPANVRAVVAQAAGTNISHSAGVLSLDSAHLIDLDALGAVSAADRFMVSTGAGAWGYETASQVRTTLGLDTNDTPTLGGVTLGSAVLTGPSANRLEVGGRVAFIHDDTNQTSAEIFFSTSAPTTEGSNGDIYFEHEA